jgi:hypothetical protein
MKHAGFFIQDPAEIVKHFKLLFMHFFVRVLWRTGVLTKAVTFEISRHGALGSYRTCVAVELFVRTGSVMELQRGFRHEMRRHAAPSSNAVRRWARQWREEGCFACIKPPGRVLISHTLTLPKCWRPSSAVRGDQQVSTLKCHECLTGVFGASCIVTRIFPHTNCKLCILWLIGTQRYAYNL